MIDDVMAALEQDASAEAAAEVVALATRYFAATRRGVGPVSAGPAPNAVAARFDEPMPEHGTDLASIMARVERDILADANRLGHPMYMGHQVSFPLSTAVWTDVIISTLNQSLAVEEMSPTLTPLEHRVIGWMCEAVGFPAGSGGTLSEPRPVVLCGEHTHYAVTRAVAELGLGMRSAIAVPSRDYRMDVDALERELRQLTERGVTVMAVVATAGHTATGAFDDLDTIGRLCESLGIRLHVDGAHGATAVLSERHRPSIQFHSSRVSPTGATRRRPRHGSASGRRDAAKRVVGDRGKAWRFARRGVARRFPCLSSSRSDNWDSDTSPIRVVPTTFSFCSRWRRSTAFETGVNASGW